MKEDGLAGHSDLYKNKSHIYEIFSCAEDSPGEIINFIGPKVVGKNVLDFGCGTGKFISELSDLSHKVIAVDLNESQLNIAQQKVQGLKNIEFYKNEKDSIPLLDSSVDIVFSAWVVGSIHDLDIREKVLSEFKRILKPGGSIYLIENDIGGDYKQITGGEIVNQRTIEKIEWLKSRGYREVKKIKTRFLFKDIEEAKRVFEAVWSKEAAAKVQDKDISLNLVVLGLFI